ncbi:MAG: UDP-3-O-(3-hydroxymyristoyl)glucosamine N-acyltransferase [Bdellovibrionales bacterium]|nr:UDP-3-O-(3-hydroxymyristoyl)glucosamine N-acyltransferase [Bdellovibrionales bacterium]
MATQLNEILEKFSGLIELNRGSDQVEITRLGPPESKNQGELVFLFEESHLKKAETGTGAVLVVPKRALDKALAMDGERTILSSPNPKLAMALVAQAFFPHPYAKPIYGQPGIHPTAIVDPSAKIAGTATVGPYAVIGRDVVVGERVLIGPHSVIEGGTQIGDNTHIHPSVYVSYDTRIGKNCEILPHSSIGSEGYGYATDDQGAHHRVTHYGRAVLEDNVHIGSGVFLDRGTFGDSVIGEGTKVDNYCHLAHNTRTGKNCQITAGLITAGSATLGNNNRFGGRTTIAGHITTCDNVTAAGVSTIHGNVTEPGFYGGYPFVELKHHLKTLAVFPHLVEMRKNMAKIMKKLGLTEE